MSKRERRRQDIWRMKRRAIRVYGWRGGDPHCYAKLADHMAVCSCWACGNPRRWFAEQTVQERRFALIAS